MHHRLSLGLCTSLALHDDVEVLIRCAVRLAKVDHSMHHLLRNRVLLLQKLEQFSLQSAILLGFPGIDVNFARSRTRPSWLTHVCFFDFVTGKDFSIFARVFCRFFAY